MFAKYLLWVQHAGFAEHLMFAEHPVFDDSGLPARDCGLGMRITHHVTACTVRAILAGSAASLNATPTLGRAPFPGSPSRPEHVWRAQQVLVAVSVTGKSRGGESNRLA